MREIVICHAREDRADAAELAEFVRAGTRLPVRLEDGEIRPESTLLSAVEEWTTGGAVLALLSPRSAPPRWDRPEWERILIDDPRQSGTRIGLALADVCRFPERLRRLESFFDLTENRLQGFRQIKRWLLGLDAVGEPLSGPGRPAGLSGGENVLEAMRRSLADAPGLGVLAHPHAMEKTALALEFAHRVEDEFEAVIWLECEGRAAAGLTGDCAAQLGIPADGETESTLASVQSVLTGRRCLLVLDGVTSEDALSLLADGLSSGLVTTRREDLARRAGERFDFDGVTRVCPDALEFNPQELDLLAAVRACAAGGCSVKLAAAIAGLEEAAASKLAAGLVSRGALLPLDRIRGRIQMGARLRERVEPAPPLRHAAGVRRRFDSPDDGMAQFDLSEVVRALGWALAAGGAWTLAGELWRRGISAAARARRPAEVLELAAAMAAAAGERGDEAMRRQAVREQVWVLEGWNRFAEAREIDPAFWPARPLQLELFG